jgi:hypothetical protein
MSAADIGALHRLAYECGVDPIDNAVSAVEALMCGGQAITDARRQDPPLFPGCDISAAHLARRVVGELLDAGWTPPAIGSSDAQ